MKVFKIIGIWFALSMATGLIVSLLTDLLGGLRNLPQFFIIINPEISCRFRGLCLPLPSVTIVKVFTSSSVGHRSASRQGFFHAHIILAVAIP